MPPPDAKGDPLTPAQIDLLRRWIDQGAKFDLPWAYAFVKLELKQIMPIESARQEIETALRRERTQDAITKLGKRGSAQFNPRYLDMSSQPDIFDVGK